MKRRPLSIRGGGSDSTGMSGLHEEVLTRHRINPNNGPTLRVEEPSLPWGQCLGVLLLVYITNQWCRSLIYYLVSFTPEASPHAFMNAALGFDQAQYGALASFAFTSLFAVSALFAGRLADQRDRSQLTALACLVWGLATVATGLAPSFACVFALRVIQVISIKILSALGHKRPIWCRRASSVRFHFSEALCMVWGFVMKPFRIVDSRRVSGC